MQPQLLSGKTVLVTGASGGIGKEIAITFAEHGAKVGIHYHSNEKNALSIQNKITSNGGYAEVFKADLIIQNEQNELIERFVEQFGKIDILVNSAGIAGDYCSFFEATPETWDRLFELNVKAPMMLSRNACKYMAEMSAGRIINISTTAIKYNGENSMPYTSTKSAMETMSATIAKWGAKHNILVNIIRCGLIETEMTQKIKGYTNEAYENRKALVPLGRAGQPNEIASMALFLASDNASFITGETFTVAGGD